MDTTHSLYKQLGLGRRCLVMRTNVVSKYGQLRLAGVKIPPVSAGDDILLMGGDYIVTKDAKLIYAYATVENERPTIEELLQVINNNA